jgi:hypothetical protein
MQVDAPWRPSRMWPPATAGDGLVSFDFQHLPRGRLARTPHVVVLAGQVMTRRCKGKAAAWRAVKWIGGKPGQRHVATSG